MLDEVAIYDKALTIDRIGYFRHNRIVWAGAGALLGGDGIGGGRVEDGRASVFRSEAARAEWVDLIGEEPDEEAAGFTRRFEEAWRRDLGFIELDTALVVGPGFDPAR